MHKKLRDLERRLKFLEQERLIDLGNKQEFLNMQKDHLCKTKLEEMEAALKRWKKHHDRDIKRIRHLINLIKLRDKGIIKC